MGIISDALKKQMLKQMQEQLFNLAKSVGPDLTACSDHVAALLQNDLTGITDDDITKTQSRVETSLGEALNTLTEVLTLTASLKHGNLPS